MKIAVLGSHPATKRQAPFDDPDWKIWACSPHNFEHGLLPRVDEWFEVHQPALCEKTRVASYQEFVRSLVREDGPYGKIPVWVRDKNEHPDALDYPEKEMKEKYGGGNFGFPFTSSIAYIIGKAIDEAPEAIGLWGIMQAAETEYAYQKPGIQHLFQAAHDAGIDIVVPEVSNLFSAPPDIW